MNRRLYRSRDDRMLAGVAGGLAELWDADPSFVRVVWAILVVLTGGFALVAYVIMAFVVPEEDEAPAVSGQPTGDPEAGGQQTADGGSSGMSATPPVWQSGRHEARAARRAARRAGRGSSNAGLLIGALLVLAGVYFLVREYIPDIDVNWLWPVALIGVGVVVLLSALRRPPGDSTGPKAPR